MNRIRHRIAAVVCVGLVAPIAISTASAGAIDQDLVLSASAGAPGDAIEVSSASCSPIDDPSGDQERFLRARLISGTGADEVLAGIGWGYGSLTLIVPDWVDPAEPGVIEATCVTATFDFDSGFVETTEPYDPVAFDILQGGAPTQSITLSRSSLLAGQSFTATGTGCAADTDGGVELWSGGDLSGRTTDDVAAFGFGAVEGGTFEARVDLVERSFGISWSTPQGGRPEDIEVEALGTDIPAGAYTAVSYCSTYDEATDRSTFALLPPQLVEVTGDAPIDQISLEVVDGTPDAALAGAECFAGDVEGGIEGIDLIEESSEFDGRLRSGPDRGPSPLRPGTGPSAGTVRSVGHNEWAPFAATPGADGTWSHPETADFEVGVLVGDATCGDPLGDGFAYDLALGIVEVAEVPPTVPTTVPAPAPAPSGAVPVTGTPTYAG